MTISDEQCRAYNFAEYRVFAPTGTIVIPVLGTSTLDKLQSTSGVESSVLMTAYNPGGEQIDRLENIARQAELVEEVGQRWKYLLGERADREGRLPVEPSVLILGISRDDALALGRRYGQLAVLFGDGTGKPLLLACHPEYQGSLIHPFHRMTEKLHSRLRAGGREVTTVQPSESGEMSVTFPGERASEISTTNNDPKSISRPHTIASADVDQIDGEMLEWSDLAELWNEHELYSRYSFLNDVVQSCRSAWVDRNDWDGDAPGQSGIWYEVTTKDPLGLKRELREKVRILIEGD